MNKIRNCFLVFSTIIILIISFSASAGPSYKVYDEGFVSADGWSSAPWGATVTNASFTESFRGVKAAKVVFTSAMGVFKPVASGGFKTTGYKHLIFAVYNLENADDLWLVAQNTAGTLGKYLKVADYSDRGAFPTAMWTWVRIPISALGLGSEPTLSYFSVANGRANATAYFDDVGFSASSVLYEGRGTSRGPGVRFFVQNANMYAPQKNDGNYWVKITTSQAGGNIQFRQRVGGLLTDDYGAVSIRFKTKDLYQSNQFSLSLIDKDGNKLGTKVYLDEKYLPDTILFEGTEWFHMTIPMSDFGISTNVLGGIRIETASPLLFWLDDLRFVQKFSWVLDIPREIKNGYKFGAHWLDDYCDSDASKLKLHTGNDYVATSGISVYAPARGFVKYSGSFSDTRWGKYIVVQHENGLATSYLHTDLISGLSEGKEVQRNQLVGNASYISGAHLHFGVRLSDAVDYVSYAGSLSETICTINGIKYPAFSDRFIDSEKMDWK